MEKLSKADEDRVIKALESAVLMVNGGSVPNDALRKVAEDNRFAPPIVQRMVEAFNVSKTLSHMKTAKAGDRAASFPLADASAILGHMYPEKVHTLAEKKSFELDSLSSSKPERREFMAVRREVMPEALKVAEYPRDPQLAAHRVFDQRSALAVKAAQAKSAYRTAYMRVLESAQQVVDHFKHVTHEPFDLAEKRAQAEFGSTGKICMDLVHALSGLNLKRAESGPEGEMVFDRRQEPYRSINRMHLAVENLIKCGENATDSEGDLEDFDGENADLLQPAYKKKKKKEESLDEVLSGEPDRPFDKAAFDLFPEALKATPELAAGMLGLKREPLSQEGRDKALADILDPQHEAAIQSAHVKAMLNDFMSNDPILSSYDPAEVSSAYNQVAMLAPSVAQQPAVMRGMLRKMLQQEGVMEPFEAHQSAEIENQLRRMDSLEPSGRKESKP